MIRRFVTLPLIVTSVLLAGSLGCAVTGSCGSVAELKSRIFDGLKVVTLARDLDRPWGFVFLPDGRALVSEKGGRLRLVDVPKATQAPSLPAPAVIEGLPAVLDDGQGGLLDLAIDPDYASQPWVYWSYSEAGSGPEARLSGTAVARGQLQGHRMVKTQVIYRQQPKVEGSGHFGSRLVFARDKTLFITLGERQKDKPSQPGREHAQNVASALGKVVRIQRDGGIPADNPRFAGAGALPELWSIGHRNPQGATLHPVSGELWITEHGPQGGDELNRVLPGRNFGWPLASDGCPYGSLPSENCRVNGGRHAPDFEPPLTTWVPWSIAPSGLAFNTGERYPGWEGQLFIAALKGEALWRLKLDGQRIVDREPLLKGRLGRIRDVRLGPDGWLYVLTDGESARLIRLER